MTETATDPAAQERQQAAEAAPETTAHQPHPQVDPVQGSAASEPSEAELPEAGDDIAAVRREAASYRRQLRIAEAERDGLRERLGRYERAEVEAIARREGMATPADLWAIGTEVPRTEEGEVDAAALTEQVRTLLRERPTWRSPLPDLGSGARESATAEPSFGEALKASRRRA